MRNLDMNLAIAFYPLLSIMTLLTMPTTSLPSADLYRANVVDHFLQKKTWLDTLFTEDVLAYKEDSKRNAALANTDDYFTKNDNQDDYQTHPKYSNNINVYEYPKNQELPQTYNTPAITNYKGSYSKLYQGFPTQVVPPTTTTNTEPEMKYNNLQTQDQGVVPEYIPYPATVPALPTVEPTMTADIVIKPFTWLNPPHTVYPQTEPLGDYFQKLGHGSINKKHVEKLEPIENKFKEAVDHNNDFYAANEVDDIQNSHIVHQLKQKLSMAFASLEPRTTQPTMYEVINQPFLNKAINHPTLNKANNQPTLYEAINQPTVERQAHKKLHNKQHKMDKSDALENLMSIAGSDWETALVKGNTEKPEEMFDCPELEGHYASPTSCEEYFQCAGGRAYRHSCQQGLLWNKETWQCDWEEKVQCGNSTP